MKVLNPRSGFPAWGSDKGTGNPQGIWPWSPAGFDHRTSTGLRKTETPGLEGTHTHKKNYVPQDSEKRSSNPRGDWSQSTYSCWRVSCGSMDRQGLTTGRGEQAAAVWESPTWLGPSWRSPLTLQTSQTQGQKSTKKGTQPHPSADNWIRALLVSPCPPEQDPVFPTAVFSIRKLPQAS